MLRTRILLAILFTVMLASCKAKKQEEPKDYENPFTYFTPGDLLAFTNDAFGNVYLVEIEQPLNDSDGRTFLFSKYSADGKLIETKKMNDFGDYIVLSLSSVTEKNGLLYFAPVCYTVQESSGFPVMEKTILFSFDYAEGKITKIAEITEVRSVFRIVANSSFVYVLGNTGKRSASYSENDLKQNSIAFQDNKIIQYNINKGTQVVLGIAEAIDIALNDKQELVIHTKQNGGQKLVQYNEEKDSVKLLAKTEGSGISCFCLSGEEIIYPLLADLSVVCTDINDLSKISCLYPFGGFFSWDICCNGGFIICRAEQDQLVQYKLEEVKKENATIRYITTERAFMQPYTCGYRIEKSVLAPEKLALKLLALDGDYDLCLTDSQYGESRNLKENGNYCDLSEVPGIQEYLDACYPYVREAATKKDGTIWMLPIEVNIPILIYDKNMETEINEPFRTNMTYSEFLNAQSFLTKEQREKTTLYNLERLFLWEYLQTEKPLQTNEFIEMTSLITELSGLLPNESMGYQFTYQKGNYIYRNEIFSKYETESSTKAVYGDAARALSLPRRNKESKNVGFCSFFVVNPNTKNKEDTFLYLADYIAYLMNRKESPLFFRSEETGKDDYEASVRMIYKEGSILFNYPNEFVEAYEEVIQQGKNLDEFIRETERKLDIYRNE